MCRDCLLRLFRIAPPLSRSIVLVDQVHSLQTSALCFMSVVVSRVSIHRVLSLIYLGWDPDDRQDRIGTPGEQSSVTSEDAKKSRGMAFDLFQLFTQFYLFEFFTVGYGRPWPFTMRGKWLKKRMRRLKRKRRMMRAKAR
jgi:hypothetical protein